MTDTTDTVLTLTADPIGRGRYRITARLAGVVVHADTGDPASAAYRRRFARALAERVPAVDPEMIDSELLRLAGTPAPPTTTDPATPAELDISYILRPEYHATEELVGVTVPVVVNAGGKPAPRWMHYIRWADGRRECRELTDCLDLSDGWRLWVHPVSGEPAMHGVAAWSATSRRAWLEGAASPDPPTVFRDLCERIAHYLEFARENAAGTTATLALWAMMTYGYPIWPAVPYLFVGGPLGSGKSTVFAVLNQLVFRPLSSSNMTAPSVFRTLHERGGTLLLDEAERLRQSTPDMQELLSVLLAGYKRGGSATRLEAVGDTFRPVSFDVYGPKALACIAGLPPALASRCISITMFRAGPDSPKPRRRADADSAWQRIRDDLHILALEYGHTWRQVAQQTDVCPPELAGRDFELWQPLLTLAAWLDGLGAHGLLAMVQRHAVATHEANKDEQIPDTDETLLELLAEFVRVGTAPTPTEILDRARERDKATFDRWTARTVSNRLKTYGITVVKSHGIRAFRVAQGALERIQNTYGIDLGFPPVISCVPCATRATQTQ